MKQIKETTAKYEPADRNMESPLDNVVNEPLQVDEASASLTEAMLFVAQRGH